MNKSAVAFFLVVLTCILSVGCVSTNSNNAVDTQITQSADYSANLESKGILKAADYNRLLKISAVIQSDKKVSDDDLDFALRVLKSPPPVSKDNNDERRKQLVLMFLSGPKDVTDEQAKKIYLTVVDLALDGPEALQIPATQDICTTGNPLTK